MWCTRWFIPLLLLPIPTATPLFLLLFVASLTLHAKPCPYCIMLLSALFASSCYWQSVPTSYLLDKFPHMAPPKEFNLTLPERASMPERCWCDMADSLFVPFNQTRWEARALYRALRPAVDKYNEEQRTRVEAENAAAAAEASAVAEAAKAAAPKEECEPETRPLPWLLRGDHPITKFIANKVYDRSKPCHARRTPAENSISSEKQPSPTPLVMPKYHIPFRVPHPDSDRPRITRIPLRLAMPPPETSPLPWLRRRYDLSKYGIGIILDFGVGPVDGSPQ
ncbi:hypothetical protein BKA62DRAFT_711117 [Auriculariales sp. MPI-PUGE-AT-0066]|nr:hypothetical protein BKA62DRAFT_711117 [Auriculariales sp. MPI-PUGE-AT-0066]